MVHQEMSALRLQVRASDCDHFGHVNNAIYVDLLEHAVATTLASAGWAEEWDRNGEYFWHMKSLVIEFRHPAEFGNELQASIWLDKYDEVTPSFGFEIHLADMDTGNNPQPTVMRARSGWQRLVTRDGLTLLRKGFISIHS